MKVFGEKNKEVHLSTFSISPPLSLTQSIVQKAEQKNDPSNRKLIQLWLDEGKTEKL